MDDSCGCILYMESSVYNGWNGIHRIIYPCPYMRASDLGPVVNEPILSILIYIQSNPSPSI